jgi:hypothetical protein
MVRRKNVVSYNMSPNMPVHCWGHNPQPIVKPISARDAFAAKVTGRVNHNTSTGSTTGIVGNHQESV